MNLTKGQSDGLEIAIDRYYNGAPYTCISGYAGTGKSTLVQFIIRALGLRDEEVAYVAYTGRASLVLRQKNCPNAQTAHKCVYHSRKLPNGRYSHRPKKKYELEQFKLIVVDEVSMLPKKMWDLLLSYGIHVIALGDNMQLPPVDKNEDNHVLDNPHILLTEIMRQALDNEIIDWSFKIREGEPLKPFDGKDVKIIPKSKLSTGMLKWADQILCSTNNTRKEINELVRKIKNFADKPQEGDKVICCKNYWDILNDVDEPLINGTIGTIRNLWESYDFINQQKVLYCDFYSENNPELPFEGLKLNYDLLVNQSIEVPKDYYRDKDFETLPLDFNYGNCITTWKAQGSSWDKIVAIEEKFPFKEEEHIKELYTKVTRANKKLVLVMK